MRINNSTAAVNVTRNLGSDMPGRSLSRLSSGYQILDGSDAVVGLVVSHTQSGGFNEAPPLARDDRSFVPIADPMDGTGSAWKGRKDE